jgi:hypothetical protein
MLCLCNCKETLFSSVEKGGRKGEIKQKRRNNKERKKERREGNTTSLR